MRKPFWSWDNTLQRLGFRRVKKASRSKPLTSRRMTCEALEPREMLAQTFSGTTGDDFFEITVDGSGAHEVRILRSGSSQWETNTSISPYVIIDCGTGNDTVTITGLNTNETWSTGSASGTIWDSSYSVEVRNAETITVDGAGGSDTAKLYDSAGNDTFTASPGEGQIDYASGTTISVENFEAIHSYATAGGTDTAYLSDSTGNDTLYGSATETALYGSGYYNRAKSFESVTSYATAGGTDTGNLYDGTTDDNFTTQDGWALLEDSATSSKAFSNRAEGFDTIVAHADNGGLDVAKLYDSSGDDTYTAEPTTATLSLRDGLSNEQNYTANDFEATHAYANYGGSDTAFLYDSTGNDTGYASPSEASLYGTSYYNRAKNFETVTLDASTGTDTAEFYDSTDVDLFEGYSTYATIEFDASVGALMAVAAETSAVGSVELTATETALTATATTKENTSASQKKLNDEERLWKIGFEHWQDYLKSLETKFKGRTLDPQDFFEKSPKEIAAAKQSESEAENESPTDQLTRTTGSDSALAAQEVQLSSVVAMSSGTEPWDVKAQGFDAVHAYATATSGGEDVALLYDTTGNDTFVARLYNDGSSNLDDGALTGTGYYNRAKAFEQVIAYATGGTDTAQLWGNDATASITDGWSGGDNWVEWQNTTRNFVANDFDYVQASKAGVGTMALNAIANVTANEDDANDVFNLTGTFTSPTFQTAYNSNPTLVAPSYSGAQVTLDYQNNQYGNATIAVRGVQGSDRVYRSFGVSVAAVNDAPVLNAAYSPVLTSINEDITSPAGNTVAEIVANGSITDVDVTTVPEAIAITWVASTYGDWQYQLAGTSTWTTFTASTRYSRLLNATDRVRFVPDPDYNGSTRFTFRAWDQTTGTHGQTANTTSTGGTTAFSATYDSAYITVNAVNDAPVLNAAYSPVLTAIDEDVTTSAGNTVASIVVDGSITDPDVTPAPEAIAITSVDNANGDWQYQLSGTSTWTTFTATTAASRLLSANDKVRFVPDANYNGSASFTFRAWDQTTGTHGQTASTASTGGTTAFSSVADTATITVTAVNDAPVLNASYSPVLTAIDEDDTTSAGNTVASIVVNGSITDPDVTPAPEAIAITAVDNANGDWQYQLSGTSTWTTFTATTAASRLLSVTDKIRFVPDANYNGSASFTFRAWDQTTGTHGQAVSTASTGGTTAFSLASDTASITVNAVNDAPVLNTAYSPVLTAINEDVTTSAGNTVAEIVVNGSITDPDVATAPEAIAITSVDNANGYWQYQLAGTSTWTTFSASTSASRLLSAADKIRFVPDANYNGSANFTFRAWDQTISAQGQAVSTASTGGTTAFSLASDTASITINSVNDAPSFTKGPNITVNEDAGAQTVTGWATAISPGPSNESGQAVDFLVSNNAAALFDVEPVIDATGNLTFTPADNVHGTATVTVRLHDDGGTANGGQNLSGTETFTITINSVNDPPELSAIETTALSYTENQGPLAVTGELVVADVDGIFLGSATIWISGDYQQGQEILAFADTPAITSTWDSATGTLNLSGAAYVSEYQAALRSVTYENTSNNPHPSTQISFTVNDGELDSNVMTRNVNITPVNDAPVFQDEPYSFSVDENSVVDTVVGQVTATDEDLPAQTLTYAIIDGNTDGAFAINPTTGQITVANPNALNYETTLPYSLTVRVTDNGSPVLNDTTTVTVNLNDVNDAPDFQNEPYTFSVDENSEVGTIVGQVTATDEDLPAQSLTYTITDGNTDGAFAINPTTGQITVANPNALDYETTLPYSLTVRVTDNGSPVQNDTATVTINLIDVNEEPAFQDAPYTFSVDENSVVDTVVGQVTATDVDAGQTLTYAIIDGNADGAFAINPTTGQITVANPNALNYETTLPYSLTVRVTDNGSPVQNDTATVTINLIDVNEVPTVSLDSVVSVLREDADTTQRIKVADILVSDDALGSNSLTLSGSDAALFEIDGTELYLKAGTTIDYQTNPLLEVTVEVDDATVGATPDDTASLSITVVDVLYWDPDGNPLNNDISTGAGLGGDGQWMNAACWYDASTGANTTWDNTSSHVAVFAGSASTVTLSSAVNVDQIAFVSSSHTLSGASITLTGVGGYISTTDGANTIASQILGSMGLTKVGAGTLIVTSTNNYSGGTTINQGTLQIGNSGYSGTLGSGDVVNDATLLFDRSATLIVSSSISGTGALTQAGTGTLILTGTNDYSGLTTISEGTLRVGNSTTTGTLGTGAVVNNATLSFYRSNEVVVNNVISGTGAVVKASSGTLILTGANTYTGGTTISAGRLELQRAGGNTLAPAGDLTITGGTLDLDGKTQQISGAVQFRGGTVQNGEISKSGDAYDGQYGTVTATLAGTAGLAKSGSGTLTIRGANTYTGETAINAGVLAFDEDSLDTTSGITFGGGTLRWVSGNTEDISSRIAEIDSGKTAILDVNGNTVTLATPLTGSGGLKIPTWGTLILTSANTYTGGTTITSGTLSLERSGGDTLATTGDITITSGTLDLGGNTQHTSGAVHFQGGTVQNGTIVKSGDAYDGQYGTVTATLAGTAGLTKSGSSTLTIRGANTYTGETAINAGVLAFDEDSLDTTSGITFGGGTLRWVSGNTEDISSQIAEIDSGKTAILDVNGNTVTLAMPLTGSGALRIVGSGTLILTGANTYTGGTTITNGTLSLERSGGDALATTGDITITSGTLDLGGNTQEVSGAVHFQGGTVQNGTIVKSGNAYDGQYGTVTATLAGTAGLTKSGFGTLTLAGANAKQYTGETTVNDGYLNIEDGFDLTYTGKITVNDYASLGFTDTQSLTGTGEILLQGDYCLIYVGGSGESSPTTLTVGSNVLIHGFGMITQHCSSDSLYNEGTIQADAAGKELALGLPNDEPFWTNAGTFAAVGAGILAEDGRSSGYHHDYLTPWEGYLWGSSSALSGTEVALSWDGFTGGEWTYTIEASLDANEDNIPDEYFTVATREGVDDDTPSTFMLSGLDSGESYYVRIVATDGTATEVYEAGKVTTLDVTDPNVPDDSSGWYRVGDITCSGSYQLDTDYHLIPITDEVPWGTTLVPATSETWTPYFATTELVPERPAWLSDASVHVSGGTGSLPLGSESAFNLDTSWIHASSPESAVLQALQGLVTDGSTPTVVDGAATVYHVRLYTYPDYPVTEDFWTFDLGRCPSGGYSDVWRYDPYDIPVTPGPPPCTDPCGCGGPDADTSGGSPPAEDVSGATGAGGTSTNGVASAGGCSACGTANGGLTYNSRAYSDTGFGPGWSDADEFPTLLGGGQNFVVRFGAEAAVWFDEDGGSYTTRYGDQQTLVHDTVYGLFVFTETDGTRYEFYDSAAAPEDPAHPQYGLCRVVFPSGATIEVPADSEDNGWSDDGKLLRVLYKTTESGQAYQQREFTYWDIESEPGRRGHVHTITLSEYDGANWTNLRQITYDYYGDSESYGAMGDLKTVVTQHWDGAAWTGDDTYYYRYYTSQYDSATNPGYAHSLKRVLLPNTYAKLCADQGNPFTVSESTIADYTCFYYEYDADRRVSKEVVFGQSNETEFTHTLSGNSDGYNSWYRKCVEERLDGTTITTYTNYIGQTLLTDVYDSTAGTHTITYNRYDDDGHLILTVDPSAFVLWGGKYYDDSLPDLVDYASDSPYLSNSDGLFQIATYYASTALGIDEDTDGGVEGYTHQRAVAHGETAARLTVGATGGPILSSDYTYFAHTVDGQTIYPTASYTTYSNEDGTGAATTEYAYTWYTDTFQVQQQTVTLPAIATDQNGSGLSTVTRQWYDAEGHLTWSMDELGRVSYYQYDVLTGELARSIDDIDAATASGLSLTPPTSWTLPAADGASETSDYRYDAFGRIVEVLGPEHTVDLGGTATAVRTATWTFYNDATHETRSASGYVVVSTAAATIVGPVSITRTDRDSRVTDRIEADYTGTLEDLATATIDQTSFVSWTTYQYVKTRLVSTRVYHDIPTSGAGTSGVNYSQTSYGYEDYGPGAMGRQNKTVAADGTITRVVLDAQGNVLETWTGTDDTGATDADPTGAQTPGNNMVQTASNTYDAAGNLLESRTYFDTGASDYYATEYQYDWRNRLTDVLTAADTVTHYEYDNLGRTVWSKTYASDDFVLAAGELRAQTETLRDDLGRIYESRTYEVDPADGTVGDYLPSNTWYDARGYIVKTATANGLFQKYEYDGLGGQVASYLGYDVDEAATDYAAALSVDGDTVIEQNAWWYDQAGRIVASATFERLPDDTTTTGELTAANSYATTSVAWYDGLGRLVATADYGREDVASGLTHYFFDGTSGAVIDADTNGIPDVAEAAAPQPYTTANPSSLAGIDFQLQCVEYNAAGRAYRTIDDLGRIDETQFDDAGRTVRTIQNYDNGTVEETDTETDITVDYEYDAAGRLVTMTAYNAKGDDSDPGTENVEAQATKYLYESAINASWQTGVVYSDTTDVLTQDAVTKIWTITTDNGDHVSTAYDRTGRTTATTDQRGVVHAYSFDSAGRLAADTVTDLGTTGLVDDAVLRVGTTYDDMGRVRAVANYSDTAGTTAVNEVRYEYNGWGQVYREYQEHDGAVDAATLFVQYDYADGATGGVAKYVRLAEVTYPNGREVQYGYGTAGAIDDIMSRLATISDAGGTLAAYTYLGADTVVTEDYVEAQVKLDYAHDNLAGFDRFGRVVDQLWTDYGADPDIVLDRYTYTYDRAGNRTGKANALNTVLSETYDYNDLDELISTIRNDGFDQSWDLDALGNWSAFDDDGTAQTRDTNAANEITSTTGIATPAYDRAGNMTTIPSPTDADPSHTLAGKYDAWNHLVEVSDGGILVAKFAYDGTGRRILKMFDSQSPGTPDGLDTYEHIFLSGQQVIETREGTGTTPAEAETLQPKYQNVWSPRYVDSLILRDENTDTDGTCDDGRLYYLADANYNVTALVDAAGNVVERYAYSAYGEATIYTPDWSATRTASLADNTTLYTGRELDLATKLYYYRARYYSAELGTFISRDPMAYDADDMNLYRYVYGSPLLLTDPLGLDSRVTGPCRINIWAGDTLYSKSSLVDFYDSQTGKNTYKGNKICPSQYFGFVGCGVFGPGGDLSALPSVPGQQQIPGFPPMPNLLNGSEVFGMLKMALDRARAFADQLCENRKEFCDDGTPQRYNCGASNQRCDSVEIGVKYDKHISKLLKYGVAPDGTRIPGLPSKESLDMLKELHKLSKHPEKKNCL